jgi:hypothetical protein
MELPAGAYQLTGSSPLYNAGYGVCRAPDPVVVTQHDVTGIQVICTRM